MQPTEKETGIIQYPIKQYLLLKIQILKTPTMPSRFKWILNSQDNGSTYTLQKDPIGWDTCSYRMERHQTYKGIFNQFTSSLKFHRMGGGKQWVDNIYQTYDIDALVTITVLIDADGNGKNYDTLFTGRLNFAGYSEDGTYTTLNIEQSDIFTKLNTRADIAVPLNVVSVNAGFYANNGQWVSFGFSGSILDSVDNTNGLAAYTFFNPYIQTGNTFYLQTLDENTNPLTVKVIFDGAGNPLNPLTGICTSPGGVSIGITALAAGQMQVQFSNLKGPVIMYMGGNRQLSLGQQPISSVPTRVLNLQGIPIPYQSTFTLTNDANSGHEIMIPAPAGGWLGSLSTIILSVVVYDVNGYAVYDQVTYTGSTVSGPGMTSSNGLTSIHITAVESSGITVSYTNVYGLIDLFSGEISSITGGSGSTGGATPLTSYAASSGTATQQFSNPPDGSTAPANVEIWGGYLTFDAFTLFDNLDAFVFAASNNLQTNISGTFPDPGAFAIPPIFSGFTDPYIEYPVSMDVTISLRGVMTHIYTAPGFVIPANEHNLVTLQLFLYWGGGDAAAGIDPLTSVPTAQQWKFFEGSADYPGNPTTVGIPIDDSTTHWTLSKTQTISLKPGDQIWLFAKVTSVFTQGLPFAEPLSGHASETYTFQFYQSTLDFKIASNASATSAEAIMVHEAFNQVVDTIADSDKNFYSEFYGRVDSAKLSYPANGAGSLRALTNGLCIRGHLDKYISMSLNEIFNNMAAIDNVGLEIDSTNRVRVEPLAFFFDRLTQIAMLPNVNKIEVHNENSYYINQIEVGYDKWETEIYFKGGLDEVHAKRLYGTKVGAAKGTALQNYGGNTAGFLKVSGKLSAVSKFIAGNYTIELTRRKNLQWSQDDFKYDNDNFIIALATLNCQVIEFFSNTILVTNLQDNPLVGDRMQITGSNELGNDGVYVIAAIVSDLGPLKTITIAGNFPSAGMSASARAYFERTNVIETAAIVLQQPMQNVIDPASAQSWLNMSITPARMLQAHMNKVTAGLQIIKGKTQFLGGSGNFMAATQMNNTGQQQDYSGRLLYENAGFNYNDSNIRNIEPLWLPEIYRFEYPITYNLFKQIKANPNGYIAFYKFSNDVKFGFILSMDYEIKTGNTKFELLRMNPPAVIDGLLNEDGTYMVL